MTSLVACTARHVEELLVRLQFILSEIGLGLRRNLSMTISVILVSDTAK